MTMRAPRRVLCGLLVAAACAADAPAHARAMVPAVGAQPGRAVQAAVGVPDLLGVSLCPEEGSIVGELLGGVTGGVSGAAGCVAEKIGGAAMSAVGNGVLDVVAEWVIGAATQITGYVAKEMRATTGPRLQSAWYEAQFRPMADLGAALGLLVALVAFASAAVRRSPDALAGALAGIARAGIGTGLVVALTAIGLGIADEISAAVLAGSPHGFWAAAAHAWGTSGFGGFASSALACLIALVELFAALFVWLELIVRGAAIYVAVLFFPVALAAAIWPVLAGWPGRLGRLLLLLVILKPVALIVLSLAGGAAAAGLSFGEGFSASVGTILAATVILALAAFAPWALMYLLAADAESAYMAAGLRTAAGAAAAGKEGRSLRNLGGLRDTAAGSSGSGGSGGGMPGGLSGGGGSGGGGLPGDMGDMGGAAGDFGAGGEFGAGAAGAVEGGALPIAGAAIGTGSVGAAAGAGVLAASTAAGGAHAPGVDSVSPGGPAATEAEAAGAGGGESSGSPSGGIPGGSPPGGDLPGDGSPGGDLPGAGASGGGASGGAAPGGGAGPAQAEQGGRALFADTVAPGGNESSGQPAGRPAGELSRPGGAGSLSAGAESGPPGGESAPARGHPPGRGGTPDRPRLTLISSPPDATDGSGEEGPREA